MIFLKSILFNICFLIFPFSYQHFRTQIDPAEDPTSPADSNRTTIPPGSHEIHVTSKNATCQESVRAFFGVLSLHGVVAGHTSQPDQWKYA